MPGRHFLFFGSWCNLKEEITMSQPSGATDFIAFIPHQVDPAWHPEWGPKLAGFPLSLAYGRARNADAGSNLESVIYWPDLNTYRADSDHREICYFTKHPNGYRVRVSHYEGSGIWRTEKFRGDVLVCLAAGATFDGAMTQTTMVGAQADE
jgi:hypothetical protein